MLQISYNITKRTQKPIYIVIHDTANTAVGADAKSHFYYFNSGNKNASADFFVDDQNVLQINDYNKYYTWHCGDGNGKYGITNSNSIGIEICINSDGNYDKAFNNTIKLVKELMKELNIPAERVVRHYDASRKNCPGSMKSENWGLWNYFKQRIQEEDSKFADIENHYAEEHIKKLEDYKLINGDGNGHFNPDLKITRADAAIMVANTLELMGK